MQLCISGNIAVMTTVTLDEGLRARKKRETRHALHRAAIELLHEGDFCDVTIDAIAARAGVSPRTFFNYFPARRPRSAAPIPTWSRVPASSCSPARHRGHRHRGAWRHPGTTARVGRRRRALAMRRAVSQRHPGVRRRTRRRECVGGGNRAGGLRAPRRRPLTDVTPWRLRMPRWVPSAALQQHVSAGFAGSIEERIDAALAAVELWPRP